MTTLDSVYSKQLYLVLYADLWITYLDFWFSLTSRTFLVSVLFSSSEAARLVLGLDFQKLDDSDASSPKALFKKALNQAYIDLQDTPCGQFFIVLQWLVINGWTHPVLQDMMKGSEIEEEKGEAFILHSFVGVSLYSLSHCSPFRHSLILNVHGRTYIICWKAV